MAELCGIVGIGQTRHQAARKDVSMAGLIREAAERALADAELTWKDIDAVVIGKAPDMFEGVMMPELFLQRRDRRRLQADAARAHGGQRRRLDRHRRREPGAGGHARPRADGRLREAVREQRDVGALDLAALQRRGRGGRRRLLRAAGARLHAPLGRARGHRHPRRAEGSPERAARIRTRTCRSPTSTSTRSRPRRCCGTRSATSRRARRRTAPAPW